MKIKVLITACALCFGLAACHDNGGNKTDSNTENHIDNTTGNAATPDSLNKQSGTTTGNGTTDKVSDDNSYEQQHSESGTKTDKK